MKIAREIPVAFRSRAPTTRTLLSSVVGSYLLDIPCRRRSPGCCLVIDLSRAACVRACVTEGEIERERRASGGSIDDGLRSPKLRGLRGQKLSSHSARAAAYIFFRILSDRALVGRDNKTLAYLPVRTTARFENTTRYHGA